MSKKSKLVLKKLLNCKWEVKENTLEMKLNCHNVPVNM